MALGSPPGIARLTAAAILSLALHAIVAHGSAEAASTVLASTDPADPLYAFSDRLKHSLSAALPAVLAPGSSGPGVLTAVLGDSEKVAFAQRDGLGTFLANANQPSAALEIYGEIPACPVAFVRRNALVRSYADLLAAKRNGEAVRIDIGPADGWTTATMSNLRALDVAWAHATVEHRGGARALSRVLSGETDMMITMAYGPLADRTLIDAMADGTIEAAPLFTSNLVRLAALHGLPYSAGRVSLNGRGFFGTAHDYETICTSLGVVVNPDADRAVAETVARIAVTGGLASSNGHWVDTAIKTATAVAERALTEVRRTAFAVAEPGLAWLTRWAQPPSAPSAPQMRPASNLKE
jgi:hypothetical protein